MPNWCDNSVVIRGDLATLKPLYEKMIETESFLECLNPMPAYLGWDEEGRSTGTYRNMFSKPSDTPEERTRDEKCGWYNWRNIHWGTKWDVDWEEWGDNLYFGDLGDGDAYIEFCYFPTAWGPPLDAYDEYRMKNPGVFIGAVFSEEGMDFCGKYEAQGDSSVEGRCMYASHSEWTADQMEDPESGLIYEVNDCFGFSDSVREYEEEKEEERKEEEALRMVGHTG